jgi:hypothetical protein
MAKLSLGRNRITTLLINRPPGDEMENRTPIADAYAGRVGRAGKAAAAHRWHIESALRR